MRHSISFLFLLIALTFQAGRAEDLKMEVGIIRFRPKTSLDLLRPPDEVIRNHGGKTPPQLNSVKAVVSALERAGVADALVSTNITLAGETTVLDIKERYLLTTPGGGQSLPDVTKVALHLEMRNGIPRGPNREIRWKGDLQWSPELIDYLDGRVMRFRGAFVAEEEGKEKKSAGNPSVGVAQATSAEWLSTNVIRVAFPGQEKGIFELPVVKSSSLSGSKWVRPEQPILQSTVAEGGGTSSQAIILVLVPQDPQPLGAGRKR
jgi:hypothetical protein